jgi:2,4-dienoyl-CoA reductase (NADPH2)
LTIQHLFTAKKIGTLELPNRVIMGSMHTGLEGVENGGQALEVFYQTRAKVGGPGLIVTGGIAVTQEGEGGNHFLGFYREEDGVVLKGVTKSVHDVGGRIAAQLFHAGRYAVPEATGVPAVAPSALRSPIHRHTPEALTSERVLETIEAFANGAKKAMEWGFDAVEIMGSEGYLINQFLSPVTNKRTDEWGGDFERRLAFPLAIIKAIREAVGPFYPVIFRMSGIDLIPGSTTEDETLVSARRFEAAGADALNIGIGWHESAIPTISTLVPRAGFIQYASEIKKHVNIPVIGSNRINDPFLADQILDDGFCDFVSMARPFLADPDLLQKAKAGEFKRINTCVACNQACLDHIFDGKSVSCLVNPLAGREHRWSLLTTDRPKQVAVIGGGVAGMEAARTLAEAGHMVTLFEAGAEIGGQLLYAKEIPGKGEFAETLRYYKTELERLNVNIKLNTLMTEEALLEQGSYDQVVVSVGVKPRVPDIPGVNLPHVVLYSELLSGNKPFGENVVIVGAGGIGCDVAHFLIEKGVKNITVMRRHGRMGDGLGKTTKWALLQHLHDNKVNYLSELNYKEITEKGIQIEIKDANGEWVEQFLPADTIVIAAGQVSNPWDLEKVQRHIPTITKIGGAKLAGELDAKRAIFEGASLGFVDQLQDSVNN